MAPSQSRQLLVWTLPTIALILSYFWFKKKRIQARTDPKGTLGEDLSVRSNKSIKEEIEEAIADTTDSATIPQNRSFSRSLSGVDSAPIDIVIPKELRSHKSNQPVISDEDLDLEIQKIKSMKNAAAGPFRKSQENITPVKRTESVEIRKSIGDQSSPPDSFSSTPITPKFKSPKVIKCAPQKIILSSSSSPMAQKHAKNSEQKSSSSKMEAVYNVANESPKKSELVEEGKIVENEEIQRQTSERDSANHSPADVMLASPSLSSISDNHSEGSNDSGKGGSDVATPTSRTPAGEGSISGDIPSDIVPSYLIYEFAIPQNLVGRLIGRSGSIISDIKEKSRARIIIKKHPSNSKMKICAIEGTQINIDTALKMIREKFPLKRFPEITLEQIALQHTPVCLTPDQFHLKLIEGVNNDTIISCMVAPDHFFVQQPTHPSFPNLNGLNNCMNFCYNNTESPFLPNPVKEHTVCAAQSEGDWYRVMVLSSDEETNISNVIFLDYGGYAYIENSKLRQIRGDFMLLPFQAAECILANIRPLAGESWTDDAYSIVADLTKGALTYTQVTDYTSDGVPLVLMYILVGPQEVVFLNEELVNRGLAEWISGTTQQDEVEGAVGGVTA